MMWVFFFFFFFFFFKQKTAYEMRISDWSSDVCSSDLIIFGVDAVHGHNNIPGATLFPHNIGLGAMHDPELLQRIGAVTAAEIAGSGIEWTFAPTLAVPQDLRWGRSYEGYSSDPKLVAAYARAMGLGLQGTLATGRPVGEHQVAAPAQHYLADGGTFEGKDQGDAKRSEEHTSELQSLMSISYAGFCLKKKKNVRHTEN